jgi:hypothetical protein
MLSAGPREQSRPAPSAPACAADARRVENITKLPMQPGARSGTESAGASGCYDVFCSFSFLPLLRSRGTIGTGMVFRIGVIVGLPM